MTPERTEELICNCGAGHGSLEGHTEWCAWLKVNWQERALTAEKSLSRLRYDTAPLIVQAKELLDQGRVADGGLLWVARDDIIRLAANHPESK